MLIPRFTIRALLVVTTICAVFFLLVGTAFRGQDWAWGIAFGVLSLGVAGLVHAACFGMVWVFAQLFSSSTSGADSVWLTSADLLTPLAGPAPSLSSTSSQTSGEADEPSPEEGSA